VRLPWGILTWGRMQLAAIDIEHIATISHVLEVHNNSAMMNMSGLEGSLTSCESTLLASWRGPAGEQGSWVGGRGLPMTRTEEGVVARAQAPVLWLFLSFVWQTFSLRTTTTSWTSRPSPS
jgi:hypothetical protein